jgi:hypothetical protein
MPQDLAEVAEFHVPVGVASGFSSSGRTKTLLTPGPVFW